MLPPLGPLSMYACMVLFPLVFIAFIIFWIRFNIRKTVWCELDDKLDGKTYLVTGGSFGVGRTLALELARRGARVIVACRSKARKDSMAFFLRSKTGSLNVRVMYMDLANLDSVWAFAKEVSESEDRLDGIINCAARLCPQGETMDGTDTMMSVNYLGHFLLTNLLLDKLKEDASDSNPKRVINVVCGSFQHGTMDDLKDFNFKANPDYSIRQVYRSTKLGMYLFTKELANRNMFDGILAFSVDPGLIASGMYRDLPGTSGQISRITAQVLYRSTEQGMQTPLYCLLAKKLEHDNGKFFKECKMADTYEKLWSDKHAKELWERTEEFIRSKGISFSLDDEE